MYTLVLGPNTICIHNLTLVMGLNTTVYAIPLLVLGPNTIRRILNGFGAINTNFLIPLMLLILSKMYISKI